jgi:hypothetical protein
LTPNAASMRCAQRSSRMPRDSAPSLRVHLARGVQEHLQVMHRHRAGRANGLGIDAECSCARESHRAHVRSRRHPGRPGRHRASSGD